MRNAVFLAVVTAFSCLSSVIEGLWPGHSWTVGYLTGTIWFGFLHEPLWKWRAAKAKHHVEEPADRAHSAEPPS
jgi:hypothetical protein